MIKNDRPEDRLHSSNSPADSNPKRKKMLNPTKEKAFEVSGHGYGARGILYDA